MLKLAILAKFLKIHGETSHWKITLQNMKRLLMNLNISSKKCITKVQTENGKKMC
jgi:6,7-dimethyl-8-ribityllumazine synthase